MPTRVAKQIVSENTGAKERLYFDIAIEQPICLHYSDVVLKLRSNVHARGLIPPRKTWLCQVWVTIDRELKERPTATWEEYAKLKANGPLLAITNLSNKKSSLHKNVLGRSPFDLKS